MHTASVPSTIELRPCSWLVRGRRVAYVRKVVLVRHGRGNAPCVAERPERAGRNTAACTHGASAERAGAADDAAVAVAAPARDGVRACAGRCGNHSRGRCRRRTVCVGLCFGGRLRAVPDAPAKGPHLGQAMAAGHVGEGRDSRCHRCCRRRRGTIIAGEVDVNAATARAGSMYCRSRGTFATSPRHRCCSIDGACGTCC